ncbi:MAG: glycosyltransferase family 4 protein [Proteobacteria bacterium]|nr:glycosyltransferase family 4 protein [Pseudomonadota bacterium]
MKILLTVHQFLPDYASGTEILALHTALEFRSRGHEVQVLTALPAASGIPDTARFDRYEFEGIPVTRFKHAHCNMGSQDNPAEQEYNNLLVAEQFARLVDSFRPDVVHFFHLMRLSASIVDVCLAKDIPMVLTPTDFWLVCPMCQLRLADGTMCSGPDPWAANCVRHLATLKMPGLAADVINSLPDAAVSGMVRIARLAAFRNSGSARLVSALSRRKDFLGNRMNRIGKVLAPTRLMQQTLQDHGLEPSHIHYCPYGIRLPPKLPGKSPRHGPLRIGLIGLGEHKGAHILIQAARKLVDCDLQIRIYGRASDFPTYVERLRNLADPRVEFCGTFPNDQIGAILADMDVLAVPSLWFENAPLVVYSAQAAGKAVIASDVGGISELVTHGDNGWLFPTGDVDGLAGIIAQLANDREQIARFSGNARMPKSISSYADELLAVYGELGVNERRPT